jgi:drug/metabolite transporter (DMT)-like permease
MPFVIWSGELNIRSLKEQAPLAFIGALNPIIFLIGLQFTSSVVSPFLYAAIPAMTAIYLFVARKQYTSLVRTLGIIIGLLGVFIIVVLPLWGRMDGAGDHLLLGNIIICLAVATFFVYGLMSKTRQTAGNTSPLGLTFYMSLMAFVLSIPFVSYELLHHQIILSLIEPRHLFAAVATGVIGTSAFYLLYQYALKAGSALTAALFTYLQPIFTILFAFMLLGERITLPFLIGGIMALAGAQLASRSSNGE